MGRGDPKICRRGGIRRFDKGAVLAVRWLDSCPRGGIMRQDSTSANCELFGLPH